jgi:hypothetical protein
MTPEQFCYWLQGFAELTEGEPNPDSAQWQMIKDHLNTVFNKVTVKRTSTKRELLTEEIKKAETGKKLEDVIKEMQRDSGVDPFDRPNVYCTTAPGRIC